MYNQAQQFEEKIHELENVIKENERGGRSSSTVTTKTSSSM